jgi:signal transduction histidine kinase
VGGARIGRGTGLRGLADRLAEIDGRLEIDSKPGQGTIVRVGLPCSEPARGHSSTAFEPTSDDVGEVSAIPGSS